MNLSLETRARRLIPWLSAQEREAMRVATTSRAMKINGGARDNSIRLHPTTLLAVIEGLQARHLLEMLPEPTFYLSALGLLVRDLLKKEATG